MRLFITGAGGFVGKELVLQCKNQGIEFTAVDIVKIDKPNHYQVDVRSKDIIDLVPEGIDAFIHLAGLTRDLDCKNRAYECFDANVMATLNLIDVAQKKKVRQFIFASTEWVYGEFKEGEIKDEDTLIDVSTLKSEYALSKLVSEQNLRQKFQYGFCPVTILRFGIIYGSRKENWSAVESVFNTVKNKAEVKVGSVKTGRCFIHVEDIARGIIKSVGLEGFNILNLQGDRLITLGEVIETSKKILNKDVKIIETAPNNISIRNVSNAKAKKLLSWWPEIDLETGLRTLIIKI